MLKQLRLLGLITFSACLIALPAVAQTPNNPAGWIPEDFAGFIRVDMTDARSALESLNIATFVASILQPGRVQFTGSQTLDTFFPLAVLDLETASFNDLVSGWLGREIIIAYPALDQQFVSEQPLLILPTRDSFRAAGDLSPAIQAQDFLQRETRNGATIYHGDQVTIAFTPSVVLLGSSEAVDAALLTGAGEAPALISGETYQIVIGALPENAVMTAYLQQESAANALNFVLNGGHGRDLVSAMGESLGDSHQFAAALASSGVDAFGAALNPLTLFNTSLELHAVAHFPDDLQAQSAPIDPQLINFVPRSAMLVHSGSDAQNALQFALNMLPLTNFAGVALSSFPVNPAPAASQSLIPTPGAEDIHNAIESFSASLEAASAINLDSLLAQFSGSYAAALLPRPNNPLPVLNTPTDGLFVAQVEDSSTAIAQIREIIEVLTLQFLVESGNGGQTIYALQDPMTGQSLLALTAVDNILVVGTGDAVDAALRADAGDNRLIREDRWQRLAREGAPQWYFDVDALYNVISPTAGGPQPVPVNQIAIRQEELGGQLIRFVLTATLSLT
ncbi:MAG: DUF3352 domain-containing protein [Anaerolineae bacterium]|nr:DUF3352 domain-containing protein [Anaerolineae bacterium]